MGKITKPFKYKNEKLNSEITMPTSGDAAYNKLREVLIDLDTAGVKSWIPAANSEVKMAQFEIDGSLWEIDPGGVVSTPAYGMYISPTDGDLVAIGLKKVGSTSTITLCSARTGGNAIWGVLSADGSIHKLNTSVTSHLGTTSTLKWVPKNTQITKSFAPAPAITQYRNIYSENVTKTITTFDSGYTSSKHGTATAHFPAPGPGEEYVKVVRGPWINNGACYSNLGLHGFGPHSGPSVTAERTTGSSCSNPNFTAAIEVEVSTTKHTAWHNTQAEADAEHAGTSETRSVSKKLMKITMGGKTLTLIEEFAGLFPKTWSSTSGGFAAPADSVLAGTTAKRFGTGVSGALGNANNTPANYTQSFWGESTRLYFGQTSGGTAWTEGQLFNIKSAGAARIGFGAHDGDWKTVGGPEHPLTFIDITPLVGTDDYVVNTTTGAIADSPAKNVRLNKNGVVHAVRMVKPGRWIAIDIYRTNADTIYYRYRTGSNSNSIILASRIMEIHTWK